MKKSQQIRLFKWISAMLPIVFIVLIEIVLRLFNVTPDLSLFVDYPQDDCYQVFNPYFSKRYFSSVDEATVGYAEPFKKEKDENTVRIFVQGASTAVGFPYFHNVSFHRQLQYHLQQAYPHKQIEIINLSLTAVNSYTIADQVNEIIETKPDAVLIYAGHNEYYGAYGVASENGFTKYPIVKKLLIETNQLALVQVLQGLFNKPQNSASDRKENNLMQRLAQDKEIVYQSDAFYNGIKQYENNMSSVLKKYQQNNIPVFISTIASNEKDLAPFISRSEQAENDSLLLIDLNELLEKGDTAKAKEEWLSYAENNDVEYAELVYWYAQILNGEGDYSAAKQCFVKAKELDALRFRAPEEINTVITKLADKYDATLVDSKQKLVDVSMNQIIGDEVMLEHVHPNITGYAAIANAFYDGLIYSDMLGEKVIQETMAHAPITEVDSLLGQYAVVVMKEKYPFNQPQQYNVFGDSKSKPEELAGTLLINQINWDQAMEELYGYYLQEKQFEKAATVAEATVLEHPIDVSLKEKAAQLFAQTEDYSQAVFYYQAALNQKPDATLARRTAQYLIKLDRLAEAEKYFDIALSWDSGDKVSKAAKMLVNQIQVLKHMDQSQLTASEYAQLLVAYLKLENKEKAIEYYNLLKEADPENVLLKKVQSKLF